MYHQKRQKYQNEFYQTKQCVYGAECIHLKNTGTCDYYHPPHEIPCYHGRNCKYYKMGQCQFRHPQDDNYDFEHPKQQKKQNQYYNDNNYRQYDNYYEYDEYNNDYEYEQDYDYYYYQSQKERVRPDQKKQNEKTSQQYERNYEEMDFAPQNQNLDSYLDRDFKKYLKLEDNKQNKQHPQQRQQQQQYQPKVMNEQKEKEKKVKNEESKQDKKQIKQEQQQNKKKKHNPDDDIIDFRNQTITYSENHFKKADLPLYADFFQVKNQKKKKKI